MGCFRSSVDSSDTRSWGYLGEDRQVNTHIIGIRNNSQETISIHRYNNRQRNKKHTSGDVWVVGKI